MTSPDDEEWGPWTIHDGAGCPVRIGQFIEVVERGRDGVDRQSRCGLAGRATVECPAWHEKTDFGEFFRIIRYRIRRPRALRELIRLVETLPAPERETA